MKKVMISICVMISFFTLASFVFAQSYIPLAPLPIGDGGTPVSSYTVDTYLSGMIKLIIALGGTLAILMAITGGMQYVASGAVPSAKQGALERVMNALTGLALILASYLILNSINPTLVQFSFNLPPVGTTVSGQYTQSGGVVATNGIANAGTGSVVATNGSTIVGSGGSVANKGSTVAENLGNTPALYQGINPTVQSLNSGTQSSFVGTSVVPPLNILPSTFSSNPTAGVYGAGFGAIVQNTFNTFMDRSNDYSIITHCLGNTTEPLCRKADLNNDGKVDNADILLFSATGYPLDVNQNKTLELIDAPVAKSCFFKISNTNVQAMLPRSILKNDIAGKCGGKGGLLSPSVSCNGATWIKYPSLGSACVVDSGLLTMPFGFVYGANGVSPGIGGINGQYSNFRLWVNGASSANSVNLSTLFVRTFLSNPPPANNVGYTPYLESTLGKITYSTISQYDLNNDGIADFSTNGLDMAVFNGCKGLPLSGICTQADFNGDGVIDNRDLGFVNFMQRDIFGASGFRPLGWNLDYFESMMFDPTGYADKQIINYCIGRTAFEKCGFADINSDNVVNSTDLSVFNTRATRFDFNGDGKVELR